MFIFKFVQLLKNPAVWYIPICHTTMRDNVLMGLDAQGTATLLSSKFKIQNKNRKPDSRAIQYNLGCFLLY